MATQLQQNYLRSKDTFTFAEFLRTDALKIALAVIDTIAKQSIEEFRKILPDLFQTAAGNLSSFGIAFFGLIFFLASIHFFVDVLRTSARRAASQTKRMVLDSPAEAEKVFRVAPAEATAKLSEMLYWPMAYMDRFTIHVVILVGMLLLWFYRLAFFIALVIAIGELARRILVSDLVEDTVKLVFKRLTRTVLKIIKGWRGPK